MKKKWLMLGGALGISSVMMITTGVSAFASTSGYDAYKSALKNTRTIQNVAVQASASLQDNGNVLASAAGNFKVSLNTQTASGSADVKANGATQSVNFYKLKDQTVLKSSTNDTYYVEQERDKEKNKNDAKETLDPQISQQVETVIDALVGNLKDYVAVDAKTDGSKEVSAQLDNSQLPTVVNAIAPIVIKHASNHEQDGEKKDNNANELPFNHDVLQASTPQLTQDIKIEKVSFKANINAANYIEHQEADITISGKDASGTAHQVTVHLQANLSGYNTTTPDTIDLSGKKVQQMDNHQHGKFHGDNE
ncbi:hypothetical protein BVG16_12320 [Paenibacillus selenitireducens]|uniref:Uncharacterized protein n=1 Tax=Paenibacillus selenitireducens TaxID=1324314 RepID=A0A1T2XFH8_9BACL|nr:hypothetical protein [Paenibacillus selenitireducens]OPA78641.1 hypothetical protein BVG16_12320 [Paenibacillus selenitireducens]